MNKSKIELCVAAVVISVCLIKGVLYGGSKPPSSTNTPMMMLGLVQSGSGASPLVQDGNSASLTSDEGVASTLAGQPEQESNLHCSTSDFDSISNWTARGAYCDWQRIDFPDAFRFPVGTNFIDAVTLFAWGEVRVKSKSEVQSGSGASPLVQDGNSASLTSDEGVASTLAGQPEQESNLLCSTSTSRFDLSSTSPSTFTLPMRVSLEPNVSSVTHGLTPSNSYLFAWRNCCVERCATNRVDASIELFRSGAVAITMTPTNGLPTTIYQLPTLPEGYYGHGQDEAWIRATFPDEAEHILAMGYENWLLNEYVGINEQNGHYLARVTVAALPEDGSPCYLVCGPYKVNVNQPGTYGFPLEVFTWYAARTYPERVTLSYSFDDGFRGGDESFEIEGNITPRPRLLLAAPPALDADNFKMNPKVVATPNHIPLNRVAQTPVSLWCNLTNRVSYFISRGLYQANVIIRGSTVDIREAEEPIRLEVIAENAQEAARGYIYIDEPIRNDGIVFVGSNVCERIITNNLAVTHVTAASQSGSTSMFSTVHDVSLPPNVSAYVAVYMATGEHVYDEHDCCDDIVSWRVSSNAGDFSGSTSVFAEKNRIGGASSLVNRLYGVLFDPFLLMGRRFVPPEGESLHFDLEAAAGNVTDGYSQTCVQIVVYPVDENGNPLDFPSWAHQ